MLNKNLYVRVKRSRDEEPAESLCIVEDSAPTKKRSIKTLETQLSNLSAISAPVSEPKRLHLSRVRTLSCADDNMLTDTSMQERCPIEPPRKKRVAARIVVTSGSKTVIPESESEQPYIVIDMAQMKSKTSTVSSVSTTIANAPVSTTAATAAASSSRITARILDPATRLLDRGITTAMKSGDFNDISAALMQGANPDHQNITGYTALMLASQYGNLRMIKRLLMKSVDVTIENHYHQTAIDLINTNIKNKADSIEIQHLLQNALIKSQQTAQKQAAILRENIRQTALMSNKAEEIMKDGEEREYVYDIYCVNAENNTISAGISTNTMAIDNNNSNDDTINNTTIPTTTAEDHQDTNTSTDPSPSYAIVRVEGLRILDSEHIELHMAYDSDWSDLGDDEEPDSNDERFHGNDYPEDEENDGEELMDDSSSIEEQPKRRSLGQRAGGFPNTTILRNSTNPSTAPTSSSIGRKVAFAGDAEDGEVNFDELLQQEEAEDSEEHSWQGEEDSDVEEEAALYRQLDGDDTEYYDSNATTGTTTAADIQGEGENSDYDMEADDETERYYHAQQQNKVAAGNNSRNTTSANTMNNRKKPSAHGKKSTTHTTTNAANTIKSSHKLSSYKDLLYDDDVNLPQFDHKFGIGKVLRPQLLGGSYSHTTSCSTADGHNFANNGLYQEVHTTESLQELWDEPTVEQQHITDQNTSSNSKEHSDRLHDMRSRTGMTFASSVREFDIYTGLAKYGIELSDDENDHMKESVSDKYTLYPSRIDSNMIQSTTGTTSGSGTTQLKYETIKPSLNTIAYDSELDNSD